MGDGGWGSKEEKVDVSIEHGNTLRLHATLSQASKENKLCVGFGAKI